jgi:hypothetical protein
MSHCIWGLRLMVRWREKYRSPCHTKRPALYSLLSRGICWQIFCKKTWLLWISVDWFWEDFEKRSCPYIQSRYITCPGSLVFYFLGCICMCVGCGIWLIYHLSWYVLRRVEIHCLRYKHEDVTHNIFWSILFNVSRLFLKQLLLYWWHLFIVKRKTSKRMILFEWKENFGKWDWWKASQYISPFEKRWMRWLLLSPWKTSPLSLD